MSQETDYCSILKTSLNQSPSINLTLKVQNVFRPIHTFINKKLDSPSFEFANSTWCIRFRSRKKVIESDEEDDTKEFSVALASLKPQMQKHKILCCVNLVRDNDVDYYKSYTKTCNFFPSYEGGEACTMATFYEYPQHPVTTDSMTITVNLICIDTTNEDSKQVQLTMDRDVAALRQDLRELFLKRENHDLILKVDGKEFQVHRNILMARSKVFEAILRHDMTEKNSGVIDVMDCDAEAMEQFLFYVYTGKVEELNRDNVLGIYYVADKYNIPLLKEQCNEFIKTSFTSSNICDVIQLALKHSDSSLLESATEYFINNTSDIFPTVEWMSFMKFNLDAANELLMKASKRWKYRK